MDKILATVLIVVLVLVLGGVVVVPMFNQGKDQGAQVIAQQEQLNNLMSNDQQVMGTTVKQYMRTAKNQGTGYLVSAGSGLTTAGTNGAVEFAETGAFTTGKIYVVVNYLADATGTYTQTVEDRQINDRANFAVSKRYDANGKANRYTFTQIDVGK